MKEAIKRRLMRSPAAYSSLRSAYRFTTGVVDRLRSRVPGARRVSPGVDGLADWTVSMRSLGARGGSGTTSSP